MSKFFPILTDVIGVPTANDGVGKITCRVPAGNLPGAGRTQNFRVLVGRNGVPATVVEMMAAMREMAFVLGTETVQRHKVSELITTQVCNALPVGAGILDIYLAEPNRATVTDEEVLAPDLRNYPSAAVEIDVVNDGVHPLTFQFDQEYDLAPKVDGAGKQILGMIGKTVQTESIGGGAATFLLNTLNGPLQRAYLFYPSAATVSRVKILQGSTVIYDRVQTADKLGLTAQLRGMGMTIPANFTDYAGTWKTWPVIFDNNQQLRNAIMNPVGLSIEITTDTACIVRLLRETQIGR